MPILASLLAAVIPMLTYLLIIWRMDKYEREPFINVFYHFLWGAFGAIIFGIIGNGMLSAPAKYLVNSTALVFIQTTVFAPIVEEFSKGIFLLGTVSSKQFDDLTDGLVYGGAIGLGFGMTENFLYYTVFGQSLTDWIILVVIRSGFTAVMHCMSTATFGAFLGIAKFSKPPFRFTLPFIGYFCAVFIHFFWNFSVSFESTYIMAYIGVIVVVILFFIVFSYSLHKEQKMILNELAEEVHNNIIPVEHLKILSSRLRTSKGWINESIRKEYIKSATKLAFRKFQVKHAGNKGASYLPEVDFYRSRIINLLAASQPREI